MIAELLNLDTIATARDDIALAIVAPDRWPDDDSDAPSYPASDLMAMARNLDAVMLFVDNPRKLTAEDAARSLETLDRLHAEFLDEERAPETLVYRDVPDPHLPADPYDTLVPATIREDHPVARRLWEEVSAADRSVRRFEADPWGTAQVSSSYRNALIDAYHVVTGDDLQAIADRLDAEWAHSGTEASAWGDD